MKQIRTYKYKLYNSKRNRHLDDSLSLACEIWNHCINLHRRYYKLYGKYLNKYQLQKHITKLKKLDKYSHWNKLGSQAIQDITDRINLSYQAFFSHKKNKSFGKKSIPHYKKSSKYSSITLKQAGYKFIPSTNKIIIMGREYKYSNSRDFEGRIKTLTVKRNALNEYFIYVVVESETNEILSRTGNSVGMDFGLKTFLTLSDGIEIESPLWYKQNLKALTSAHRKVSRCEKGSNNRQKAAKELNRIYLNIVNHRRNWFFELSNELTSKYATIFIEDLNLNGMKKLWGRKVSDLAYAEFINILEYVAYKNGSKVIKVDRYFASSKTCSVCGSIKESLSLKEREWTCPDCGAFHNRDLNAAINIKNFGLSLV